MHIIKKIAGGLFLCSLIGVTGFMALSLISEFRAAPAPPPVVASAPTDIPPDIEPLQVLGDRLTINQMLYCIAKGSEEYMRAHQPEVLTYGPFALTQGVWSQLLETSGTLTALGDCRYWEDSVALIFGGLDQYQELWRTGDLQMIAGVYVRMYKEEPGPKQMQAPSHDSALHLGYIMRVAQQAYGPQLQEQTTK